MPKLRNVPKPSPPLLVVDASVPAPATSGKSNVRAKGKSSPTKRASSLVPFPTPPRTTTKRKRARSRITDSEEEDEQPLKLVSDDDEDLKPSRKHDANGALVLGYKKRKTLDAIAEELSEAQVEEAFWMGTSATVTGGESSHKGETSGRGRQRSRSRTRSPSSSPPPAPHLLRRQHTGLASPPPSRRQPRTRIIRNARTTRAQTTPVVAGPAPSESRGKKPGLFPTRDSPDNPFLADASDSPASAGVASGPEPPRTPKQFEEKPTMTWVFRGKKVELANPHYRSPDAGGSDRDAAALLPETHSDYSPPATYAPKLLFPDSRRDLRRRRPVVDDNPSPRTPTQRLPTPTMETRSQARARLRATPADSDDEGAEHLQGGTLAPNVEEDFDEAIQAAMANRLAQRIGTSSSATHASEVPRTRTRTQVSGAPRPPTKDTDQARRAMGPVRPVKR